MTKSIRIENADTSDHKVTVQVWEVGRDLGYGEIEPDMRVEEISLDYPTSMVDLCIHDTRYLVVKEK